MNYTKHFQISLTTNEDTNFGYMVFDTLPEAELIYKAILTGCFTIGFSEINHTPTIELSEFILDENEIGKAKRILKSHLLGDEDTDAKPVITEPFLFYDHAGYYETQLNPAFGLTL
ncbi:MAG: hypothetical protein K9H61_02430 [Bacteroidia bacterium]|nr:hypothetical protein [Bacteroidia bacterium]MCF8427183.1 hypothetical protein [Bacteroidia bacterium]MCF8445828.1 hypothetical protein [Bacteroidia bacterium]